MTAATAQPRKTKAQQATDERNDAIAHLQELLPPGSTVYTNLRHVSASGMSRSISVHISRNGEIEDITYWVLRAIGGTFDQKHGGIKRGGCGMDMGYDLMNAISYTIHRTGFTCPGKNCPSNDHSNGDRDYTPHHHDNQGGYSLRHRWL